MRRSVAVSRHYRQPGPPGIAVITVDRLLPRPYNGARSTGRKLA